jgi:hypothetical protein
MLRHRKYVKLFKIILQLIASDQSKRTLLGYALLKRSHVDKNAIVYVQINVWIL